jgi:hypothetical protein
MGTVPYLRDGSSVKLRGLAEPVFGTAMLKDVWVNLKWGCPYRGVTTLGFHLQSKAPPYADS